MPTSGSHLYAALAVAALVALPACSADLTDRQDELSYQVDEPVRALVVDAQAAGVVIDVGEGPVTVTEEHRYSRAKPVTAHAVQSQVLRLTESGCGDDDARCDVRYRIRVPAGTRTDITAQAGAIRVDGLVGDLRVTTQAAAVEGRALRSDQVTIATEAGAAELEFREAPALVRTTTTLGAVSLRVPGDTSYAVDVTTTVGAARVQVPRDPGSRHRIEVRTEVGGVAIEPTP